jgi:hypothetical protein
MGGDFVHNDITKHAIANAGDEVQWRKINLLFARDTDTPGDSTITTFSTSHLSFPYMKMSIILSHFLITSRRQENRALLLSKQHPIINGVK